MKGSALTAGIALLAGRSPDALAAAYLNGENSKRLSLSFKPYTLELKHVFTLSSSSRSTTPVVLTQLQYGDVVGYGEASMPPYLGESHESAASFLSKVNLGKYENPFELETILGDVDAVAPGNPAAKTSVDIALHDVVGTPEGANRYVAPQGVKAAPATGASIHQGALEGANQDVVEGTLDLVMMQRQAEMMQRALPSSTPSSTSLRPRTFRRSSPNRATSLRLRTWRKSTPRPEENEEKT